MPRAGPEAATLRADRASACQPPDWFMRRSRRRRRRHCRAHFRWHLFASLRCSGTRGWPAAAGQHPRRSSVWPLSGGGATRATCATTSEAGGAHLRSTGAECAPKRRPRARACSAGARPPARPPARPTRSCTAQRAHFAYCEPGAQSFCWPALVGAPCGAQKLASDELQQTREKIGRQQG